MPSVGVLIAAVRAPSLTAGAMPVLTATALAAHRGYEVHWLNFTVTLIGMLAVQSAVNLVNDYFDDESGLDADPDFAKNPFPLGSRVIQTGALSTGGVARFAAILGAVAVACGLYLNAVHPGQTVLIVAAIAGLLGYFYTAPPLRIAYHGAGEPITFLLFGPMAGVGAYYVQTGGVDVPIVVLSSAVGVMAMAILFMHHFPQHDADKRHGKRTPIVRLGTAGAGKLVPWMLVVPYLMIAAAIPLGVLPPAAALFFLTIPFAILASRTALHSAGDARQMTRAFASVMGLHFTGGLLLTAGLALG